MRLGSTWTPPPMLHHTIIPWSPETMRRLYLFADLLLK
jgi:hypothetical protein